MSQKIQFYLLALLLLTTVILTTRFFNFGMMALTTFVLAYLSKGMRRYSLKKTSQNDLSGQKIHKQTLTNQ